MRGFFAGMNGVCVGLGYSFATYMGLAFHGSPDSSLQWRGPFGIALIFSFIPLAGMIIVPESPRFLLMSGSVDQAKAVMRKLHNLTHSEEQHFAVAEFYQMQKQIEYDKTLDASWLRIVRKPSYRKRAILTAGISFLAPSTAILGKRILRNCFISSG